MANTGKITQIIGPVVDVSFEDNEGGHLPNILDAMEIVRENGQKIILECQQHLGENRVRTIAMDSTNGLLPRHDRNQPWLTHYHANRRRH